MLFNVPQFIDIEDKIVGPLTAKQLGWMAIAGVILLVLWTLLEGASFFIIAIIVFAIFGALAFYKPYGQPFIEFITSSARFVGRPKIFIWERNYDSIKHIEKKTAKAEEKKVLHHTLNIKEIRDISKELDKIE
jgi:hypothetical protein